ncbi:hypothetical protein [Enterovibrio nigricans]|uniref:Methyl-accepting chemotaxis protein n=1 Tax=Enterovibrio nigricans DSM 22720 TaxID=1121868 RepID=A0A1T4WDT4_9GAMM|nr:hypothetical protein [Enterovibrio nigricans]PKF48711.1 hypothetical protein AT251_24135 [Enterovibrio nigricans]SKA75299.1 hypothetical protein SAMN02745132_04885 [Enterovibrio nigricans DSM 22720]
MSRSKSSQRSSTTNTNINNVLDGGAIKQSFDFAAGVADEAFDSVDTAIKTVEGTTAKALSVNAGVVDEAFDTYSTLADTAMEAFSAQNNRALDAITEQSNRSLDTLSGLQGQQASNNVKLLEGIQKTIRNDNTGGVSEFLDSQVVLYGVIGVVIVALILILGRR